MKKSSILKNALMGSLLMLSLAAGAMEAGMHGANPSPEAIARCQADPVKCEEMKKRAAAHREACKQDPEACKKRREEMRQKMRAQCEANPEQCRQKMQEFCQANPDKCKQIKERQAGKSPSSTLPADASATNPAPAPAGTTQ